MQESQRRLVAFKREIKPVATFRGRLDTIMHWTGWRPREFATAIGVDKTSIHNWVRGIGEPGAGSIRKICARLGVTADWLLGLSDKGGPAEPAACAARPKPKTPEPCAAAEARAKQIA